MASAPKNWVELNEALRDCDEAAAKEALRVELSGPRRLGHLLRIHARLNKLRARRERAELQRRADGKDA